MDKIIPEHEPPHDLTDDDIADRLAELHELRRRLAFEAEEIERVIEDTDNEIAELEEQDPG